MSQRRPRKATTEAEKLEDAWGNDQVDAFFALLRFFVKVEVGSASSLIVVGQDARTEHD